MQKNMNKVEFTQNMKVLLKHHKNIVWKDISLLKRVKTNAQKLLEQEYRVSSQYNYINAASNTKYVRLLTEIHTLLDKIAAVALKGLTIMKVVCEEGRVGHERCVWGVSYVWWRVGGLYIYIYKYIFLRLTL